MYGMSSINKRGNKMERISQGNNSIQTEKDFQAFKVFDLKGGQRYIFFYDPERKMVTLWNESDKEHPYVLQHIIKKFPYNCVNAWEYFKLMWQKSVLFNSYNVKFLGWCNPESFELYQD